MKKLLLAGVAAFAVAGAANTASAEIDIELGGFVKGYASFVDQDETAGNVNVPGGKASKSLKSDSKGHGTEKKGKGEEGGTNTDSVIGS